jgi:hypothetical protein
MDMKHVYGGENEEFNDLCLVEEMALQIEYKKFKHPSIVEMSLY